MMGTPPDGKSPARLSQNDVHLECKKKKRCGRVSIVAGVADLGIKLIRGHHQNIPPSMGEATARSGLLVSSGEAAAECEPLYCGMTEDCSNAGIRMTLPART